jgi:hypothetical protein
MFDPSDAMGGCGLGTSPCINCDSEPRDADGLFCSQECSAEFHGLDEEEF